MMNEPVVILYVEDDLQSREIMRFLLLDVMGIAHVHLFEDSSSFIERVKALQPKPTMILLDIHIRPCNGFEMLALLRQHTNFADLPIVALTASVMNEEVNQLKQAGFSGVIAKPVGLDRFPDVFNRLLRGEQVWRVIA